MPGVSALDPKARLWQPRGGCFSLFFYKTVASFVQGGGVTLGVDLSWEPTASVTGRGFAWAQALPDHAPAQMPPGAALDI